MPNLIPVDFYTEGKAKHNLSFWVACNIVFQGNGYICSGHKGRLWGGQPNGFGHSVRETQLFQSIILKLSVLGYAIR